MNHRRGMSIVAAVAAALCLAGCDTLPSSLLPDETASAGGTKPSTAPAREHVFALSYSQDDVLNPYKAKTGVNLELASLLYEGLVSLDKGLMPQTALATSIAQDDPLHPVVTLRGDARFSDGSAVTGADVTASFQKAKASAHYRTLLRGVTAASASGQKVTFTLSGRDPRYEACLTFPIVKASTADSDAPIGTGLYFYKGDKTPVLAANPHHAVQPKLATVQLHNLTNQDAILHGLENGSISFFYSDLLEGNLPRTSSASISAPQNYLCYLGVNASRSALAKADVRQAISASISRSALAKSAFSSRAQAALTPFHPAWTALKGVKGLTANENIAVAVAHLQQAGYNTKSDDVSGGKADKALSLEVLVNEGNSFHTAAAELLKTQLAKSGITLTVTKLAFNTYKSRIQKKDFDLYIGGIRLNLDLSLQPLLLEGGAVNWGVKTGGNASVAYRAYLAGDKTLQEFVTAFSEDLPFIPLCWQDGIVSYNRALSGVAPTVADPFAGVAEWTVAS